MREQLHAQIYLSPATVSFRWTQCLINAVVSMGRRNTFLKFTRRSLKT